MPMRKLDSKNGEIFDLNKQSISNSEKRERAKKMYGSKPKNKQAQKEVHTKHWQLTRKEVIIADGAECQRCLALFGWHTVDNLEVHHIKPRSQYPELTYDLDNLVTVCHTCNLTMGEKGIDFDWTPENRFREIDDEIHLGGIF